ncbi:MAG: nucleotidyl transferase AbiEii/AbiGii toxin family protein [Candidatus Marinimicrobia bacterium]|nr:nucleotidyl transferase AbiEii/AbiGii toxin family protein [Candidatus Neomarinimicrobiota bacterium]
MIHLDTLSREWIMYVRGKIKGSDPGIIERLLRAYYLVEQLVKYDLEFVFKGGTCLTLLTHKPQRFSTDVDVITQVKRGDLESILTQIVTNSAFEGFELDDRRSYQEGIPKAHYALKFDSVVNGRPTDIQLDLLFTDNAYPEILETPIMSAFIKMKGDPFRVQTPSLDGLMGDKLTAFAPNTVGIRYGTRKELEIIKQLYDLNKLFDEIQSFEKVAASFDAHVVKELQYRSELMADRELVLKDMLDTCVLISKSDSQVNEVDKSRFEEIKRGLRSFRGFTINQAFRNEETQVAISKVALVTAKLLKGDLSPLPTVSNNVQHTEFHISNENEKYRYLNKKLRSVEPKAQFFWYSALKVLGEL